MVPTEESKKAPELALEKPKEDEKKESAKAQSPPRRKSPERKKDDEKKREDKPIAAPKIEATAKPANGEADKDAPESCKADGAQKNADGEFGLLFFFFFDIFFITNEFRKEVGQKLCIFLKNLFASWN